MASESELAGPADIPPTGPPSSIHRPGTLIAGRYKLLEEIGEGGMGTVWLAEQSEPVRRRVAIKLIKAGMDSRQVVSRFSAERQALALMDHPNIAKVFDGGMTDEGRPFFVMEYVKGVRITQYCDNTRLSIRQRLELMVQVCQAVQHAHQKGVIHRDLKPGNILVCLYDGQPVPKLLDFGLAKATGTPLTEQTLFTAHGMAVGTPVYMSPEQAEFNNLDIDTRTDIYSLGVILYELLTGTTPLDKRIHQAAWQEALRLIKEEESPKPSSRLLSSRHAPRDDPKKNPANSLESLAAKRAAEPAQLIRLVQGDLDWITMKALEKERSRRYETASGLARDIERYLQNEPVQARPPSSGYRLRKFVQRNKAAALATLLIAASLLLGSAISTWQAIRATTAERQAQKNLEIVKQVAREWATGETLSGDPQRAEAAIRVAEAAKVSKAWTEILRAQSEISQGLYQAPTKRLAPIKENDYPDGNEDSRLAAQALSVHAHHMNGDVYATCQFIEDVKTFHHELGPEASLFKAAAQIWIEPYQAIQTLDAAARKRPYPTSLLIRSKALANCAIRDRNYDLITEALNDLKYAEIFAGESAAMIEAKLWAHLRGRELANRLGKKAEAQEHLNQLQSYIPQWERLPKTPEHVTLVAAACWYGSQIEKGLEFGRKIDWGDAYHITLFAAVIDWGHDPTAKLMKLEQFRCNPDNPYALAAKAHILADIPSRRKELPALHQRIVAAHPKSPGARIFALQVLALMGKPEELKREAEEVRRMFGDGFHWRWREGDALRYLSGEWDKERALKEATGLSEPTMHYAIGMERLAAGDRKGALLHFKRCMQTNIESTFWGGHWASRLVSRMNHDPNWPDWIE